jgi:hypothetical protein
MAVGVMHRLAMKFRAVLGWMIAAPWQWPVVALAKVEIMINVSVEI